MIEYVISKDDFHGAAEAILVDGVSPYSKKTKENYISDGFAVVDEIGMLQAFDYYAENICGHWKEISEEQYDEALNVLPPAMWHSGGFYISERLIGDVSAFYQRFDGRYFSSNQRMSTPRDTILQQLQKWITEQEAVQNVVLH